MAKKDSFGAWGEEYAARYLGREGYQIVRRNWRSAAGEVDIVARAGTMFVICEVKTRKSISRGHPSQAVTPHRLHRLVAAAELWLADHPRCSARVDVISIIAGADDITLEHAQAVTV